jgi:hypothetical protein
LTDWEARAERARELRHRRRMDWLTAPIDAARTAAILVLWLFAALVGLGAVLAVARSDLTLVPAPLFTAMQVIAWLVWFVEAVWRPVLIGGGVLGLVGLWQLGRRSGSVPGWAAPAQSRADPGVVITPVGVAAALAHSVVVPPPHRVVHNPHPRAALFVDLAEEAGAHLARLGKCARPGWHGLGQVVPLARQRVDARVDLHAQRTAGEGLDLAALPFRRLADTRHEARLGRLAPRLAPREPVHLLGPTA